MENIPDAIGVLSPLAVAFIVGGAIVGIVWGFVRPGDHDELGAAWINGGIGAVAGGLLYLALAALS